MIQEDTKTFTGKQLLDEVYLREKVMMILRNINV